MDYIDELTEKNSIKILNSFIDNRVSEMHFSQSTGYGYSNVGRDVLNKVFAQSMDSEDALVSENFVSGTHAISTAILSLVRPGDTVLFATGFPYDTLDKLINASNCCSLRDLNVNVEIKDYLVNNDFIESLKSKPKIVYIQRSKGYTNRKSLSIYDIKKLILIVRDNTPDSVVVIDNCYGEFLYENEPTFFGADLIVGSLIKNPGAGISVSGGYICGKKKYINLCKQRFLAPGLLDIGASSHNRELFMGLFYAPLAVKESLKTAKFASTIFSSAGFKVSPEPDERWNDIITSVDLKSRRNLEIFCKIVQNYSPVDSFVTPEAWDMPGYNHQVIMSSGGFISGSSIELSCDAPVKEPFTIYLQGGTNFYISKYVLRKVLDNLHV